MSWRSQTAFLPLLVLLVLAADSLQQGTQTTVITPAANEGAQVTTTNNTGPDKGQWSNSSSGSWSNGTSSGQWSNNSSGASSSTSSGGVTTNSSSAQTSSSSSNQTSNSSPGGHSNSSSSDTSSSSSSQTSSTSSNGSSDSSSSQSSSSSSSQSSSSSSSQSSANSSSQASNSSSSESSSGSSSQTSNSSSSGLSSQTSNGSSSQSSSGSSSQTSNSSSSQSSGGSSSQTSNSSSSQSSSGSSSQTSNSSSSQSSSGSSSQSSNSSSSQSSSGSSSQTSNNSSSDSSSGSSSQTSNNSSSQSSSGSSSQTSNNSSSDSSSGSSGQTSNNSSSQSSSGSSSQTNNNSSSQSSSGSSSQTSNSSSSQSSSGSSSQTSNSSSSQSSSGSSSQTSNSSSSQSSSGSSNQTSNSSSSDSSSGSSSQTNNNSSSQSSSGSSSQTNNSSSSQSSSGSSNQTSNSSSSQSSSGSSSSNSSSSQSSSGSSNQTSNSSSSGSSNQTSNSSSSDSSSGSSSQTNNNSSSQSSSGSSNQTSNSSSSQSSSGSSSQTNNSSSSQSSSGSSNQTSNSSSSQSSSGSSSSNSSSSQSSSGSSNQTSNSSSSQSSSGSSNQTSNSSSSDSSSGSSSQTNNNSSSQSSSGSSSQTNNSSSSQSSSGSSSSNSSSSQSSSGSSNQTSNSSSSQSSSGSSNQTSNSSSSDLSSGSSNQTSNSSSSDSSSGSSSQTNNNSSSQSSSGSSNQTSNSSSSQSSSGSSSQTSNSSSSQSSSGSSNQTSNSSSSQSSSGSSSSNSSSNSSSSQSSSGSSNQTSNSSSSQSSSGSSNQTSNSSSSDSSSGSSSQTNNSSSSQSSSGSSNQTSNSSSSQSSSGSSSSNSSSNSSSSQSSSGSSNQTSNSSSSQSSSSSSNQTSNSSSSDSSSGSSNQTSNSSSSQSSSGSSSQSSNSSSSNSSSQTSNSSSSSSSNQTSNSSSNQSSNSSSSQSSNSSSSQTSNSSSEWNMKHWYSYYSEDSQMSFNDWRSYFYNAQSKTAGIKYSYDEWYKDTYSSGALECNTKSFVDIESVIIMNIHEALLLNPEDRGNSCISLKQSVKLGKSILQKCEQKHDENWDSSSANSVLQTTSASQISVYKAAYRLICSACEADSGESSSEKGEDAKDMNIIRNTLLTYIRIRISWNGQESLSSETSLAVEEVRTHLKSCPSDACSVFLLLISEITNFGGLTHSSLTCNIQYVDNSLSSVLLELKEADDNNVSSSQNVKETLCKKLKFALATAVNHTRDCSHDSYSGISVKIDKVKKENVERCGEIPRGPQPCVVVKPDHNNITWSLGRSFFVNRTAVCRAAETYKLTSSWTSQYCNRSESQIKSALSCLTSNCSEHRGTCGSISWSTEDQLKVMHGCLKNEDVPESITEKIKAFLMYIRNVVIDGGDQPTCASQDPFEQLVFSATSSLLTGDTGFCSHAQDEIDQWYNSCENWSISKMSITAIFSLACESLQIPSCDISKVKMCCDPDSFIPPDGEQQLQNREKCMQTATVSCPEAISIEGLKTVRDLEAAGAYISSKNNSTQCVCDPAAAVNCIMDVHHEAKQITPDWKGLCSELPKSEACARSYIEGCDECKKQTVSTIVHKLSSQLEKICVDPPETECKAVSAMQCITNLAQSQTSYEAFGSDSKCIEKIRTEQCVFENLEKCDELTSLAVTRRLEDVLSNWKHLKCQEPEDQLKDCKDIFETRTYELLGIDKNDLWTAFERNNTDLWNKFNILCQEVDVAFSCINASLYLQRDKIEAVIVGRVFEALYTTVQKECKLSPEPLECYSCQGVGQDSCEAGHTTETCQKSEICETSTSEGQNVSIVTSRGCVSRTSCKAGCDKDGCTYCCAHDKCNSLDNGPVEGTWSLAAMAECVFELSEGYIKKDFKCSSVNVALACIKNVQAQSETEGVGRAVESLTKLNLPLEVQLCLIQEANQTCEDWPLVATSVHIFYSDKEDLCGVIDNSRKRVAQAAQSCPKDQYLLVEKLQHSLESTVGNLDCREKYNFTIDIKCKSIEALQCVKTILGVNKIENTLTCKFFSEIVTCIKAEVSECSSDAQLLFANAKVEELKTFLPPGASCSNVELISNPAMSSISNFLNKFIGSSERNIIGVILKAIIELFESLVSQSEGIFALSPTDQLAFQSIFQFIEYFMQIDTEGDLSLSVNVSEVCFSSLEPVMYKHVTTLFGIPFLPLNQWASACSVLEEGLVAAVSNCDLEATAVIFNLLDDIRVKFLSGFCPEIKPVARCNPSVAEECFEMFLPYIGHDTDDDFCLKASIFTECAISYRQTCDYEDLTTFREKEAIAVDIVSQACTDNPELTDKVRCDLLGRVKATPGCSSADISDFNKATVNNCREVENKTADIVQNAGTCITNIPVDVLNQFLDEISACRYGNGTRRADMSTLTSSCDDLPYSCDVPKAKYCLYRLLEENDVSSQIENTKQCLEKSYYCSTPVMSLIKHNISLYAPLVKFIPEITPNWTRLESNCLRELLTLYVVGFTEPIKNVSMNLWDMCYKMSESLDQLQEIIKNHPDEVLQYTLKTVQEWKEVISDLCETGDVSQELALPPNGIENQGCPVELVNAYIDVIFSLSLSEFHPVLQLKETSVCSIYTSLKKSLEGSAEASFSLRDCSSGFINKAKFAVNMAVFLKKRCEEADYDIQRCDYGKVEQCVTNLYDNLMDLGKSQTIPGFNKVFKETDACVMKYSYKCDKSTRNKIELSYKPLKQLAQQKFTNLAPSQECNKDDKKEENKCDERSADKCILNSMKIMFNPIMSPGAKCSDLHGGSKCSRKNTESCTRLRPWYISTGPEKVNNLTSYLGCKDDNGNTNVTPGCRDGCSTREAYKCIDKFTSEVTEKISSTPSQTICRYINDLELCVAQNTKSCQEKESEAVLQALDGVLQEFKDRQAACVNVRQCSKEFDVLVRQIANIIEEDTSIDSKNVNQEHSNDNNGNENDKTDRPSQSLNSLCVTVKNSWTCLQKGFQLLPKEKKDALVPVYNVIWPIVDELCSNTRELECYSCKNKTSIKDCEVETEFCQRNRGSCMLKQSLVNNSIRYDAGCSEDKVCPQNTASVRTYNCKSDRCNKKANADKPCELDTGTCRSDYCLKCALDYCLQTIQSDAINCSDVSLKFNCIQTFGFNCSRGMNILNAVSKVHFSLASTTCVVNATPNDWSSLALNFLLTALRSPYISDSFFISLKETTTNVNKRIASGTYPQDIATSLKLVLYFLNSIVGNNYIDGIFISDGQKDDKEKAQMCSGHIYYGITNIYKAFEGLAGSETIIKCRESATYAAIASQNLKNCNIPSFVSNKLDILDNDLTDKCQVPAQTKHPEIYPGVCQASVVFNYIEEVIAAVKTQDSMNCRYLIQLNEVYSMYTSDCTSIQQSDIVNYVSLTVGASLEKCKKDMPNFNYVLEIKRDIFYAAVSCKQQFQNEMKSAFYNNDQKGACEAFGALKNCSWNIPKILSDFIIGKSNDTLSALSQQNICGDMGNDRQRRETSVCHLGRLSDVFAVLLDPYNINIAPLDSKVKYCENIEHLLKEGDELVSECTDELSKFQRTIYNITKVAERLHEESCPPTLPDTETCDLKQIPECSKDLGIVSGFATLETPTLCRASKSALECLIRISQGCSNTTEDDKVLSLIDTAKAAIKQTVGNTCPLLTLPLYCDVPVTENKEACQSKKAEECRDNIPVDLTKIDDEGFCLSLQENVGCVQGALAGCLLDQIKHFNWSGDLKSGICGIADVSLNNVCSSVSICSTQTVQNCFTAANPTSCPSLQAATDCKIKYFNSNKEQCQQSLGYAISQYHMSTHYSRLADSCGQTFNATIPEPYSSACVDDLMEAVDLALSYRTDATASEALSYICATFSTCLSETSENYSIIITLMKETITQIQYSSNVPQIVYNKTTDMYYADTDRCYFSHARGCLGALIMKIMTFKLLTLDERKAVCSDWRSNSVENCLSSALDGCHETDRVRFSEIAALVSQIIENLKICEQPELCYISEAEVYLTDFITSLTKYGHNYDNKTMCTDYRKAKNSENMFLSKCSEDSAKRVRENYKQLEDRVKNVCEQVVLPEPICPGIQDKNLECSLGNAFSCIANFPMKIFTSSDSIIVRLQCLNVQKMMVCAATNLTSCDLENKDVKDAQEAVKQIKARTGYQCPMLSEDLCSQEKPCPVINAGCELDVQVNLINREKPVCEIRNKAYQCVEENTKTCTRAQKVQGKAVIDKRMTSLGLPSDLSCESGSMDGFIYSFLSAIIDILRGCSAKHTCEMIISQYSGIVGSYSNEHQSYYKDLAMTLIDKLKDKVGTSKCSATTTSTCSDPLPVWKFKLLITPLALKSDFAPTSFCTKCQEILQERTRNGCYKDIYDTIVMSKAYIRDCTNENVSCTDASLKIENCIKNIGVFSSLSCRDKQKAALCITKYLPPHCNYSRPSLLKGDLCNDTVILQASHKHGEKVFVSENGLEVNVKFKCLEGNCNVTIKQSSQLMYKDSSPSCLEGSQVNEPIPQIYTGSDLQMLQDDKDEITFTIGATQDHRKDGNQTANVTFVLQTENKEDDESCEVIALTVNVEDSDQPQSMCSSINDPHVKTCDNMMFNVMLSGSFIAYVNSEAKQMIIVDFMPCAQYGTCNCGVNVFAGNFALTMTTCEKNSNFITMRSAPGTSQLAKPDFAVYVEENGHTYHMLLRNGALVTVQKDDKYLLFQFKPAGSDCGKMLGLFGNYNSDPADDFQTPNCSMSKLNENDGELGIVAPNAFSLHWKVSNKDEYWKKMITSATDSSQEEAAKTYCFTPVTNSTTSSKCSNMVPTFTCGFISGEDQTVKLLSLMNQHKSTESKRRRKRQAPVSEDNSYNQTLYTGPIVSNWTISEAIDYCMAALNDQVLEACRSAVASVFQKNMNYDDIIKICVDDLMRTNSTIWIDGYHREMRTMCRNELNTDPQYQKNSNSSDLALAFLDMTCVPFDCNGHGKCYRGQCFCNANYVGAACNVNINDLKPPILLSEDEVYFCEIGPGSDCNSVFLTGINFVSSSRLSCHVRELEMMTFGLKSLPNAQVTIVRGELVTSSQVRCDTGSRGSSMQFIEVSVSNDGKVPYETYQKFIAYDPACYDCNFETCTRKRNVCIIGNKCVVEGASSIYSACQYCNPNKPNDWSIRPGIPECEHLISDDDNDNHTLVIALIAVGCSLAVLLIITAAACVISRRRSAKRKEAARRSELASQYFNDRMPFDGSPITAYRPWQKVDSLAPPKYQQYN